VQAFNHMDGHHLEIDGARIYFEQRGDGSGTPLVLLHGGFGSMETFNPMLPFLDQSFRVIGIDSRGQGKSTLGSEPLTYARLQQDVEQVLAHLGLSDVTIMGHSDGGIVALRMAANGNVTVSKLVTIGAHWALPEDDPARPLMAGITAERWRTMFPDSYNAYQRLNPEPDFAMLTEAILKLWLDTSEQGYPGEDIWNIPGSLLVVRGDEDMLISRQHAVDMADMVPGALLLNVPFAGHCVHEEHPERIMPDINTFLATPPHAK